MLHESYPAVLLYLMATLDSALVGFRVASGRNLHIRKRQYFRQSMRQSFIAGQCLLLLSVAVVLAALRLEGGAPEGPGGAVWQEYLRAGGSMLFVYGPYSVLVVAALALYLIPKTDSRSLATVVVLGPFTMLRPYVFLAGLAVCWATSPSLSARVLATFGVGLQLCLEPALEWRRSRDVRTPTRH